jgi:hypothetical protein
MEDYVKDAQIRLGREPIGEILEIVDFDPSQRRGWVRIWP